LKKLVLRITILEFKISGLQEKSVGLLRQRKKYSVKHQQGSSRHN